MPVPDTGGKEFTRALPPVVDGSTSGVCSVPSPVRVIDAEDVDHVTLVALGRPSVGELPLGRPLT